MRLYWILSWCLPLILVVPSAGQPDVFAQTANGQQGQQPSQSGTQSANPQNQQWQTAYASLLNQYYPQLSNRKEATAAQQPANPNYNWRVLPPVWDSWSQTSSLNLTPADDALRAHLGLSKDEGLVVTLVNANGPAAQAGLQQNDVLLKLGETSLAKVDDLDDALKATGEKPSELTILRAGKKIKIAVQPRIRVTIGPVEVQAPAYWIGVPMSPIEPALRSQLKLPGKQGLLVLGIVKGSPAEAAHLKVHDILLTLGGQPLDSQEKFVQILQANKDKKIAIEILREGKSMKIDVVPARRNAPRAIVNVHNAESLYQLVRPGVILPGNEPIENGDATVCTRTVAAETKSAPDATAAIVKRLDELDGQMKRLSKVIDELSTVLKDKK